MTQKKQMRYKVKDVLRLNLKTNEKFKSWLAGLLDGEGNFYINSSIHQIRINLEEKDKYVLKLIKDTVGGKLTYKKPQKSWKPNWSPQWVWGIYSFVDCMEFTKWILPDLILKKSTAIKFLNTLESQYNEKKYGSALNRGQYNGNNNFC